MKLFEVYAIQNPAGQWFKPKGRDGYGSQWHDDVLKAKLYTKLGTAERQVTCISKYNGYVPKIVKFDVTATTELNQDDRIKAAREKKEKAEAKKLTEQYRLDAEQAKVDLEKAKRDYRKYYGDY